MAARTDTRRAGILSRAEPPEVFRATSAMLPTLPGSIASARAPDPGPSRRCLRVSPPQRIPDRPFPAVANNRVSERVGLSAAEPRQYCQAVSAILHWSAEDSPTPSPAEDSPTPSPAEDSPTPSRRQLNENGGYSSCSNRKYASTRVLHRNAPTPKL